MRKALGYQRPVIPNKLTTEVEEPRSGGNGGRKAGVRWPGSSVGLRNRASPASG